MEEDQEPEEYTDWEGLHKASEGTTRQAIGHHMAALGMPQDGGHSKAEWKALTKEKLAEARTARLTHMVAEARKDGPLRSDEAYMQGATPAG